MYTTTLKHRQKTFVSLLLITFSLTYESFFLKKITPAVNISARSSNVLATEPFSGPPTYLICTASLACHLLSFIWLFVCFILYTCFVFVFCFALFCTCSHFFYSLLLLFLFLPNPLIPFFFCICFAFFFPSYRPL